MRRTLSALAALAAALTVVLSGSTAASADGAHRGHTPGRGYYLALGDSLAAGYQPGLGDDKTGGYVGGVEDAITMTAPRTRLVNLSCSGERADSLALGGPFCTYREGSQLAAALHFLHRHGRMTRQITIDIGANNVQRCVSSTLVVDYACIQTGMTTVATYLPSILEQLEEAAPKAQILVLNYYNPFLAAYLAGPAGQELAATSAVLQSTLNGIIAQAAAQNGATLVDIAGAFRSTDTTPVSVPGIGTLPTNVATICTLTWMCAVSDIHANDAGYQVMAQTVVADLRPPAHRWHRRSTR